MQTIRRACLPPNTHQTFCLTLIYTQAARKLLVDLAPRTPGQMTRIQNQEHIKKTCVTQFMPSFHHRSQASKTPSLCYAHNKSCTFSHTPGWHTPKPQQAVACRYPLPIKKYAFSLNRQCTACPLHTKHRAYKLRLFAHLPQRSPQHMLQPSHR